MNPDLHIESKVIENFIIKSKRERYLNFIKKSKTRKKFTDELAHFSNQLELFEEIKNNERSVIDAQLKRLGDKVHAAHAHGALGYLTATGPILNAHEARRGVTGRPSAFYGLADSRRTIPGAWISTARASAILRAQPPGNDDRLRALQQTLNESQVPQSVGTDTIATLRWDSAQQDGTLKTSSPSWRAAMRRTRMRRL